MKHIIIMMLLLSLMVSTFTGCKKEKEASVGKDDNTPTVEEQEERSAKITIEDQVLVDQDGIRIAVLSYEEPGEQEDGFFGPEIILSVKNSREETISLRGDVLSINNLMSYTGISDWIETGTEKLLRLQISPSDLDFNYTENITTLDIKFIVENVTPEKIETILETEPFTINTSLKGKYKQEVDDSGLMLYHENDLKIIYQGINEEHSYYTRMKLYIENNSDKELFLVLHPEPGELIPEDWDHGCKVLPGKKTYAGFILKEEVIKNLSELDLKFKIYEENEYTYLRGPDFLYETDIKTIPVNLE